MIDRYMNRFALFLGAFLLLAVVPSWTQEVSRGVYQIYPDTPGALTKAPAGYKPFYISHFGRHGSRYISREQEMKPALDGLRTAQAEGILTPSGTALLGYVEEVYLLSDGLWGQLSARGAMEHRHIANRMNKNFPGVMKDSIGVYASTYPRCIVSMASATTELGRLNPKARITYHVGDRYQDLLNPRYRPEGWVLGVELKDDYLSRNLDVSSAMPHLFTDTARASAVIGDPVAFFKAVYAAWSIREAILLPSFALENFIGSDAAVLLGRADNMGHYQNMGLERGADTLLLSIVQGAERAIASGKRYADLRYAHDNGLLRLLAQMGVEGYPGGLSTERALDFDFARAVPMASNLQMIFYRNAKGTVLVQILVNESEAKIPALTGGPYYNWTELSAYLKSRIRVPES